MDAVDAAGADEAVVDLADDVGGGGGDLGSAPDAHTEAAPTAGIGRRDAGEEDVGVTVEPVAFVGAGGRCDDVVEEALAHGGAVAGLEEERADGEAVGLVAGPPGDEGSDRVLDLDIAEVAGTGGEGAAEGERGLVVHADDDAVAILDRADGVFGRRELRGVAVAPVGVGRADRGVVGGRVLPPEFGVMWGAVYRRAAAGAGICTRGVVAAIRCIAIA